MYVCMYMKHMYCRESVVLCFLSCQYLSDKDAKIHCILGSGVQARTHAHALKFVRDFTEVGVCTVLVAIY